MKKKCLCLTGLMVLLLISFIYCEAEELNTLNAYQQVAPAQKQGLQKDNAALSTPAYPKEKTKHLLPKKTGDLLHIAFEKGYIGEGVKLEPLVLHERYTIEVIVKPSGKEVVSAGVLSNHVVSFEGFTIERAAADANTYYAAFGDGAKWLNSVNFKLKPGVWNYLAVVFGDSNSFQVYVDGSLVGTIVTKSKIKNSPLPLQIGNWTKEDRPFNGSIAEVRLANSSLEKKDIELRWSKLKPKLSGK